MQPEGSDVQEPGSKRRWAYHGWPTAFLLFVGLLLLYHLNGEFLVGSDATPNVYLPLSVLEQRKLSFTPEERPFMFIWSLKTAKGTALVKFDDWDAEPSAPTTISFTPALMTAEQATWRQLRETGRLCLYRPDYFLVPSIDPARRGYIGQYGPGAGLTALPFVTLQWLVIDDLAQHKAALWYGAKFVAAFCVAVSAAVVYLTLLRFVDHPAALMIAIAYGVGTCVWSVASQTLWQSGPNVMFLSLTAYCLVRLEESDWWAVGCSMAAACGVVCRPTSALVVLTIGVYLTALGIQRWRQQTPGGSIRRAYRPPIIYILVGLPPAIWLAHFNWYYLGSPVLFGQTVAGRHIAASQLGSSELWPTPVLQGLAGLLLSPSRGMLVYSPVLLFAFWGVYRVWREPRLAVLRPLGVAVLLLLAVQAKWFDWHGGHSFGYRLMVDAVPLLALCSVPAVALIRQQSQLLALFSVMLAWSIGVQVLGAYAYDVIGWNAREVYAVQASGQPPRVFFDAARAKQVAQQLQAPVKTVRMDVDLRPNRRRLWSVGDSQLVYYLTHFAESRRTKQKLTALWLEKYVLSPW